jgi:FMN-dependent NADH-azoreductase
MSTILHITASIRRDQSITRDLSNSLVAGLADRHGAQVITRNLADNDLPFLTAERFAANLAPADQRTPEQVALAAIGDELIAELEAADTIVFGIPIYNFGAPSGVKAWADLVARAGRTFRYTEQGPVGLLTGKKVYLAVASGGTPVGGEIDFFTPWFKFFLGFIGITDVTIIAADGILGAGGEEKVAEAKAQVLRLAA